jgi:hypothetical protein
MRTSIALAMLGCLSLAAGCGDDTNNGGADMSVVADMTMGGGTTPTCADYCAKNLMNCKAGGDGGGGNVQYASSAACMTYCTTSAGWMAGTSGATSGNTIGCRTYHSTAAAADPVLHCPHAGPTGGSVCGTYCENYCQLLTKNCTGANAVAGYDATTCMTKCMGIPTGGKANDASGNTIQCRIYHLSMAAAMPSVHCPHAQTAADLPGGPCT